MFHLILFLIFGAVCIAGAVNLLAQRHPINSALSLVVVMGSLAVVYLLLGAEFVAAVQVIVYAGAIMVLFVFVIMLLNAGEEERSQGNMAALGALLTWSVMHHATVAVRVGSLYGDPRTIGKLLFSEYLLPFEITSLLILIAIMGAVVLASKPEVTPVGPV